MILRHKSALVSRSEPRDSCPPAKPQVAKCRRIPLRDTDLPDAQLPSKHVHRYSQGLWQLLGLSRTSLGEMGPSSSATTTGRGYLPHQLTGVSPPLHDRVRDLGHQCYLAIGLGA